MRMGVKQIQSVIVVREILHSISIMYDENEMLPLNLEVPAVQSGDIDNRPESEENNEMTVRDR